MPDGAAVGEVFKVEAEADLDGLTITTVFPPKGTRKEAERLENEPSPEARRNQIPLLPNE